LTAAYFGLLTRTEFLPDAVDFHLVNPVVNITSRQGAFQFLDAAYFPKLGLEMCFIFGGFLCDFTLHQLFWSEGCRSIRLTVRSHERTWSGRRGKRRLRSCR